MSLKDFLKKHTTAFDSDPDHVDYTKGKTLLRVDPETGHSDAGNAEPLR
jgi:hypothetical protein